MSFTLIESKQGIFGGKPIFVGTRIPINIVLELIEAGWTRQRICKEYPGLTEDHISEAVKYARSLVANEEVFYA